MNARALKRLAVAPLSFVLLAACSAAPESIATSDDALNVGVGPVRGRLPAAPAWPVPNGEYCDDVQPSCSITEMTYADVIYPQDSQLASLGCTPPLHLSTGNSSGMLGAWYAVCYDSPAVRATMWVDTNNDQCSHCLPHLPAGEIYVLTGPYAVGPNCPSGCPGSGKTLGGGGGGNVGVGGTSSH